MELVLPGLLHFKKVDIAWTGGTEVKLSNGEPGNHGFENSKFYDFHFATWYELVSHFNGAYGTVDMVNGVVDFSVPDAYGAIAAINDLSRVAARWVGCAALHDVKVAEQLAWVVEMFTKVMGNKGYNLWDRLIYTPAQQAAYANGLVANLATISAIKSALAAQGKSFSSAKYNRWRVTAGRPFVGLMLTEVALKDVSVFAT